MELGVLNDAITRIAVDMNVGAIHENADLEALTLDVFLFKSFLNSDNGTIGRGDELLLRRGENTPGNAEEERHKHPEDQEYSDKEEVKEGPMINKEYHGGIDNQHYGQQSKY